MYRVLNSILLAGTLLWMPMLINAQDVVAETPAELTIHVVQRGENLFRIARRYGLSTQELADLNGIANVSNILVGQRLLVPAAEAPLDADTVETHIVQPGETLFSIAQLYNLDVNILIALNNDISNANQIYPGQILNLIETDDVENTPQVETTTGVVATATTHATDNAILSTPVPQSAFAENITQTISGNIHIVQPGETLFRIATGYNLTVNEIASVNSIIDPTQIFAGQQLIIPGFTPADAALDVPAPITDVLVDPLIFIEGETGLIQLTTNIASQVRGTFLNSELTVIPQEDNTQHFMLIGIPLFTTAGTYPVNLNLNNGNATQTDFTFNIRVRAGGYTTQNLNVSAEQLELLAPAVQENELNLLKDLMSTVSPQRLYNGPFGIPAAAAMNGSYGTRRSYNGGPVDNFHAGADFASAPNTPILAAAPGRVVLADRLNIRGNTIVLDHGWGVYTLYAHQNTLNVAVGQMVSTGDVIGLAGSTGRVTGPHLHWEVWVNGTPVNPLTWLQRAFP